MTEKLFIAPGNGGTGAYGENVAISPVDFQAIEDFVAEQGVELLVVGNEDPLVAGVTDYFKEHKPGLLVVGPEKAGAMLEGSKDFAKRFMVENMDLLPFSKLCLMLCSLHKEFQATR